MTTETYWQRFQHQRISRRRLLATAGLSTAGLVAVTACGGGDGEPATLTPAAGETPLAATPTLGEPKRGGVYKTYTTGDWGTIDPSTTVGTATQALMPRLYNVLFSRSNADPTFIFWDLAASMERPDEVTYVFTIRPGVKVAPNDLDIPERDMDSFDAKANLDRAEVDEDHLGRSTLPMVESWEAPDAKTYILKTVTPYAYFMSRLGRALGGTIPPREFFERGIGLQDKGVGAGPFVVRPGTYQESGGIILDRNANYYRKDEATGQQLPHVDAIDFARIVERQARRTAFLDGQIHTYSAETIDEANEILSQEPDVYLLRNPVFTFISFTMNVTRPPWDDDRVRKAALYALDRQQFADLVFGEGEAQPNGIVHWPCGAYALPPEELEELQPHDRQKSRELIRAATGEDTIRIKVTYPLTDIEFHDKHLPIFLQQMREAGFVIDENPQDFGTWLADYTRVRYDASLSPNQIYETSEIALDWQSSKGPQGDENFAVGVGALYPEIDEALIDSKSALSTEEHVEKVRDVQRLIYEKGPSFLPITSWSSYNLYWNFVKNMPSGLGDTQTFLSNWWLDL